jgi:hypothetical protein
LKASRLRRKARKTKISYCTIISSKPHVFKLTQYLQWFLKINYSSLSQNIRLDAISVAQSKIANLTTLPKVSEMFTNLKEIDLEDNLFGSWEDIFKILDELKHLRLINVSNNILKFPDEKSSHKRYDKIRCLVINKMGYSWQDVRKVL